MSTIILGAVLLAITGLVLFRMFAKKKKGAPSCSSCDGCSGCVH